MGMDKPFLFFTAGLTMDFKTALEISRDENIARYKLFWDSLNGVDANNEDLTPIVDNEDTMVSRTVEKNSVDRNIYRYCQLFPDRSGEITQLFGHLENTALNLPPLVCCGIDFADGTADLIKTMMTDTFTSFIVIPCCGHSSLQQLIGIIWFEFRKTFRNSKYKDAFKYPTKFKQLCSMLHGLMEQVLHEHNAGEAFITDGSCHILLEHLDSLFLTREGAQLAVRLLQLNKYAHEKVRVVATTHNNAFGRYSTIAVPAHISVIFRSHSNSKVTALLWKRLETIIQKYLQHNIALLNLVSSTTTNIINNEFYETLLTAENKKLSTLWGLVTAVWRRLYGLSIEDAVRSILVAVQKVLTSSQFVSSVLLQDEKDCLQQRVRFAVKEVLPIHNAKVVKDAVTDLLSLSMSSIPLDASKEMTARFNSDWRRCSEWCEMLSRRTRCLIVACFVASVNPWESDVAQLTEAQRGRRKKARVGSENDTAAAAAGNSVGMVSEKVNEIVGSSKVTLEMKSFSAERLYSILCRLMGSSTGGDVKVAVAAADLTLGDPTLDSSIAELVEKRFLSVIVNSSGTTAMSPMYISNVSYDTASDAAASVNLRLSDYLVVNETVFSL